MQLSKFMGFRPRRIRYKDITIENTSNTQIITFKLLHPLKAVNGSYGTVLFNVEEIRVSRDIVVEAGDKIMVYPDSKTLVLHQPCRLDVSRPVYHRIYSHPVSELKPDESQLRRPARVWITIIPFAARSGRLR